MDLPGSWSRRVVLTDEHRRARLVARHHLDHAASTVGEAVAGVVAIHSSDPATPFLSLAARVADVTVPGIQHALYDARSLWRLHAMRRTLFVVPAARQPVFQAATGAAMARRERKRLVGWLESTMPPARVEDFLSDAEAATMEALVAAGEATTTELTAVVPALAHRIVVGSGRWTQEVPLSTRLLHQLAYEARILRTRPAGSWRSSQYRWAAVTDWFGAPPDPPPGEDEGAARLLTDYLAAHGPATEVDVRWWTGWTVRATRRALGAVGAAEVELQGGRSGWVLPDDVDSTDDAPPAVTLLPALDATPMGWKERGFFLEPGMVDALYDRNGNVGPTVWIDGRIVGGWAQQPDGRVVARLLVDVPAARRTEVDASTEALTAWLDGSVVVPRFRTPLERELSR